MVTTEVYDMGEKNEVKIPNLTRVIVVFINSLVNFLHFQGATFWSKNPLVKVNITGSVCLDEETIQIWGPDSWKLIYSEVWRGGGGR